MDQIVWKPATLKGLSQRMMEYMFGKGAFEMCHLIKYKSGLSNKMIENRKTNNDFENEFSNEFKFCLV